jgi:hypothetical protein
MRRSTLALGLTAVLMASGCSSPIAEVEQPPIDPAHTDILTAAEFVFAMGEGSGRDGLDVFRVDGKGEASYIFRQGASGWRRALFQMSPKQVGELRKLLVDVGYLSLKPHYSRGVADGTQWCVRLDAGGGTKRVYCDNQFPQAIERLSDFVHNRVLTAHRAELANAVRIREKAAMNAATGLWPKPGSTE